MAFGTGNEEYSVILPGASNFDPYSAEITAKSEVVAGATTTYAYAYTNLGQLDTSTKNSVAFEDYDYDANGNRTKQVVSGVTRTYTYDNEDHLDKVYNSTNQIPANVIADYNYDVDGFLTSKIEGASTTTYDYSSSGELKGVVLPSGAIQEVAYDYDVLGRRVAKKVKQSGNWTTTEKYLWAGMNQGLLAVYDGGDNLVARFEYAGGRMPVSVTYSSATYYLAYDQVGSLRAIFNTSGTKVYEITYDSYGNILSESGSYTGPVPFGFAGGLHDRTTGLVLFGHRDYDPKVGRWTAKDPIGFAGGDVNLYGYVLANPVSLIDPAGLYEWGAFFGGFWSSLVDNSIAVSHPFAQNAWENSSLGQAWENRDHYPVASYGALGGAGAAVGAAGAAVCLMGGEAASAGAGALFRPGGLLNSNRYLRIGIGRHQGPVFRIAGDWVARFRSNPHIDLFRIWWRK